MVGRVSWGDAPGYNLLRLQRKEDQQKMNDLPQLGALRVSVVNGRVFTLCTWHLVGSQAGIIFWLWIGEIVPVEARVIDVVVVHCAPADCPTST